MKASTIFCANCGASNPAHEQYCFFCSQPLAQYAGKARRTDQVGQLKPGDELRQRYKIVTQIGQGGFGAVYKAEDQELGQRLVAVKEMSEQNLSPQALNDGVESFKREALMLAALKHEHLPRVYDHFEEDGHWYLVMDYIEGETLEERLGKSRDGSLPQIMALKIALQLCNVLDYLHTRQPPIIFRDLKPSNVILMPEGGLALIDFGIARNFKPGKAKDTIAFGSPGYAAPEQYGKAQTTPRADVYSLGAILHQMLSGDDPSLNPFRFAPLRRQDAALQQLVAQMLEMDENRRPASGAAVRHALEHIRDHPVPPPRIAGQIVPAMPITRQFPAVPMPQVAPVLPRLVHTHHYGIVRAVGWSPDNQYAASATDAIVRVWSTQNGQNLCSYREHMGLIKHMAWSPTEMRIASVSEENKVHIWDASTGETLHCYPGDPKAGISPNVAHLLAWSPNGRYLAVAGNHALHIWDTQESEMIIKLKSKFFYGYRAICWSPDGKSLAAAQAENVVVYRLEPRGKPLYYRYNALINAVAWSPNGSYISAGGHDHMIHTWDIQNNKLIGTYRNHLRPITALAWSPDSRRIVSSSLEPAVHIWDALTGWDAVPFYSHASDVMAVAWSPDGRSILTGGSDCRVCVWPVP